MQHVTVVYPGVPSNGATSNTNVSLVTIMNHLYGPTSLNAGVPTKATTMPAIGMAVSDQRPMPTRIIGEAKMHPVMITGCDTSPTTPTANTVNTRPFYFTMMNPGPSEPPESGATATPQQPRSQTHAFNMPRSLPPIKTSLSPSHRGAPRPLASPHRPIITPTGGERALPRRHRRAVRKIASADDTAGGGDSRMPSQSFGVVVTGDQPGPGMSWRAALVQTAQQQREQIVQLARQQEQLLQQQQQQQQVQQQAQAQLQQQQLMLLAQQVQQAEDGSSAMHAAIQMMEAAAKMNQPATVPAAAPAAAATAIPSAQHSGTCTFLAASLQQQDGSAQQQQQPQLQSSGSFDSATGSSKDVANVATCVHPPAAAPTAAADEEQKEMWLLAMLLQEQEAVLLRHQQELAAAAPAVQQAQQALQALQALQQQAQQSAGQQQVSAGCEAASAAPAMEEEDMLWLWSLLQEEDTQTLQQQPVQQAQVQQGQQQVQPAAAVKAAGLQGDSWMWDLAMQEEEEGTAAAGCGARSAAGLKRGRQSSWDEAELLQVLFGDDCDEEGQRSSKRQALMM